MDGEPTADVVVVGGGPAGAALATRVASAGREVVLIERQPAWRWRACGVFSSPVTVRELRALGVAAADLAAVAQPIPRLWVESPGGSRFAMTYGAEREGDPTAVGFDRSHLDPMLLDLAERSGARILRGTTLVGLAEGTDGSWRVRVRAAGPNDEQPGGDRPGDGQRGEHGPSDRGRGDRGLGASSRHGGADTTSVRDRSGSRAPASELTIRARVVVGADGIGSRVAREVGATRRSFLPRVGLTFHVRAPDGRVLETSSGAPEARMVVLRGAYCGLAPVPGGRVNVGIVLGGADRRATMARYGARAAADSVVREAWHEGPRDPTDRIAGASPIAHRVARRAGDGWLLIGDAAGFLDPFTGEGLHRALVSARLGADAVLASLAGSPDALRRYDATMGRRFRAKDLVSWVVQLFVAQPGLFEYAANRLARRPGVRFGLGEVLGDLRPAADALDPRFLAHLLRP